MYIVHIHVHCTIMYMYMYMYTCKRLHVQCTVHVCYILCVQNMYILLMNVHVHHVIVINEMFDNKKFLSFATSEVWKH